MHCLTGVGVSKGRHEPIGTFPIMITTSCLFSRIPLTGSTLLRFRHHKQEPRKTTTMALVYLKSIFFPHKKADYSGERQGLLDVERQSSITSGSSNRTYHDKASHSRGSSLFRCRINPRIISDATIGLSDGLTVPFALTAGLSAIGSTRLVIYAGFVCSAW